jgi:RsmE family RNA methyltransferase
MNRILFENLADVYELDARDNRFEHVRGVLRMRPGDQFDVGVINGPAGKATMIALEDDRLRISVKWDARPELPPPVHLLVGLCRPATARKVLTVAPTLGVRSITFCGTGRSDPAYARSGLWKNEEWRARLIEGVEQAFDTFLPEVRLTDSLSVAVEALPAEGPRLALDVYEGRQALSSVKLPADTPVCLAVGPERGWNRNDRDGLNAAGFQLVSLNERVLRVETAVTVGLTLVLSGMGVY